MKARSRISKNLLDTDGLLGVIDAFPSAVLHVDKDGIVRIVSGRFGEFFDVSISGMVDKPFSDFSEPISRGFSEYMSFHEIFGVPMQDKEKAYLRDAEISFPKRRFLQITSRPVSDKGVSAGRVWMFRDITQEREITQLKIEYGGVRSADELKSRFMTVISHQLRTPLGSIRWNSELLLTDYQGIPEEANEIVRQINTAVIRSISIVDDMIVAADIERRALKLEKSSTDISDVIRKVVRDATRTAAMKSVTLSMGYIPESIPQLFLDRQRIEVAIGRIVDNAITYSPEGRSIDIGLRVGKKDVTVEITDHGVGIPEDEHARVFEKFYRAKGAIALNPNASGLGLYITKYIIEAHDGKIDFVSEEGKGTKFMVMLPRKAAE